ncbi:DUF7504 family protein [Halobacterium zhouii]|uniref:DUF7504 family protein n=1 Tax=Halobacterium zhouii TaxID=2902624 RepID=UPI001E5C6A1E|nr:hypothetical protein [Halobacterium zhouii]
MSDSEMRSTLARPASTLDLTPGEQLLFEKASKGPPFDQLPEEAFDNLLVVSTALSPSVIEQQITAHGHDPRSVGVVPITATDYRYDGPLWVSQRVEPSDLTGISIEVSKGFGYLEPSQGWLTFDSISTLLMYAEEDRVYRLLAWLASNSRENEVRSVFSLVRSMLADESYQRFRGLWDDVVSETG